jgi:undecaprenyl-diphosphatase
VAVRWAGVGVLLVLAGLALGAVASGPSIVPGDLAVALAVQSPASAALDSLAVVVSRLGDTYPTMVLLSALLVILLALHGRHDLAMWIGLVLALRAIGPGLKRVIDSPRPTADAIAVLHESSGLGYPSGHALGAALFYGAVIVIAPRVLHHRVLVRTVQLGAVVMIVTTALARVRLGVHWPSDVVGGVVFGIGFICLLQAVWLASHRPERAE